MRQKVVSYFKFCIIIIFIISCTQERKSNKLPKTIYSATSFKDEVILNSQYINDRIILYNDSNALRLCYKDDSLCITEGFFKVSNDTVRFYCPDFYEWAKLKINNKYICMNCPDPNYDEGIGVNQERNFRLSDQEMMQKFFGQKIDFLSRSAWIFQNDLWAIIRDSTTLELMYPDTNRSGYYKKMSLRMNVHED